MKVFTKENGVSVFLKQKCKSFGIAVDEALSY